jgi:hypothetical protein
MLASQVFLPLEPLHQPLAGHFEYRKFFCLVPYPSSLPLCSVTCSPGSVLWSHKVSSLSLSCCLSLRTVSGGRLRRDGSLSYRVLER